MEVEQARSGGDESADQRSPDQNDPDSNVKKYPCPDCDKSYRAKETLNRHRKNHARTAEHICQICSVAFRRKDLLLRHSKIHRGDDSNGEPKDRQRIRQACDRCSKLKTKCDANSPCTSCVRGQHECSYSGRTPVRTRHRPLESTDVNRHQLSTSPMASMKSEDRLDRRTSMANAFSGPNVDILGGRPIIILFCGQLLTRLQLPIWTPIIQRLCQILTWP